MCCCLKTFALPASVCPVRLLGVAVVWGMLLWGLVPPAAAAGPMQLDLDDGTAPPPGRWVYDPQQGRSRPNAAAGEVPSRQAVQITGSFTLEAFVRPAKLKGQPLPHGEARAALALAGPNDDAPRLAVEVAQSRPPHSYPWHRAALYLPASPPVTLTKQQYKSFTHASPDAWRHVAVVYDAQANTLAYFHDYTLLEAVELPVPLRWDAAELHVGGTQAVPFPGYVDSVRLSHETLRPEQFLRARDEPLTDVSFASPPGRFPADAGVVNVRTRFGAVGDGRTDDTAAFQKAFDELASRVPLAYETLYVPAGTYLVRDTVGFSRFLVLQGEGRDETVIKLADGAPNFADKANPRPLLALSNYKSLSDPGIKASGRGSGSAIGSYVFDLTLDTGRGNPGAIALDYHANNHGRVENVRIVSGDGEGSAGISMMRPWPGPALIRNVSVDGFDRGIQIRHREYSMTLEDVTLTNQREAGIVNGGNILAVRKLTSRNRVPAIISSGATGMITLLESRLTGNESGGTGDSAVRLVDGQGALLLLDVEIGDYATGVEAGGQRVPIGRIGELTLGGGVYRLWPGERSAIDLPFADEPTPAHEPPEKWVNVLSFRQPGHGNDLAPALQAAIDSGARTIYLPANGNYRLGRTVELRGEVRHVIGLRNELKNTPAFAEQDPAAPLIRFTQQDAGRTVFLDGLEVPQLTHASPATLVIRDGVLAGLRGELPAGHDRVGDLFASNVMGFGMKLDRPQRVYIRQFNPENHDAGPDVDLSGPGLQLACLGFKTEYKSQKLRVSDGASAGVFGAFIYPIGKGIPADRPIFEVVDAHLAVSFGTSIYQAAHQVMVQEARSGEVRRLSVKEVEHHGPRGRVTLFVSGGQDR